MSEDKYAGTTGMIAADTHPEKGNQFVKDKTLEGILRRNLEWSTQIKAISPDFFTNLAEIQTPKLLWIGCADSRVSANVICGLAPGEVFVHRNVANLVNPGNDLSCLSVIQYAVEALKVPHIVVCGHYGCGGVATSTSKEDHGLIDNWLLPIKAVYAKNREELEQLEAKEGKDAMLRRLCELNTIAQALNVCRTTIVQKHWNNVKDRSLTVHAWIYDLKDGRLKDLYASMDGPNSVEDVYRQLNKLPA